MSLVSGPSAAMAADVPKATDLIFEHKHLAKVDQGGELKYNFRRTANKPELLGQPFSDVVTLKVAAVRPEGGRDLDLQIYSGDRARDLQKLGNMNINPVFTVYFSQAVATFMALAGGQMNYFQRAISLGFRDKAKVEPIKVDYKGKSIDAYHVILQPYVGDPNEVKMQGWEKATMDLIVSDQVPGEIADLKATYTNKYQEQDLKLVEQYTLDGVTGTTGDTQ